MVKMQMRVLGQGRPLVIVGQGLTGVLSWVPHANELASERQVALAQPLGVELGLAHASLPVDYSVKLESRALAAALTDLGWREPVNVVGWSYGGLIALDFALDHPERIRSLLLVEPDAAWLLPDYGRADPEVRKTEESALRWADGVTEDELAAFMTDLLGPDQPPRQHPRWSVWNQHRDALRASIAIFRHRDDVSRLRRLSMPVMLVKGTGTDHYNAAIIDALAAALANVSVVELPGGHMSPVVSKDEFLEKMRAFQK